MKLNKVMAMAVVGIMVISSSLLFLPVHQNQVIPAHMETIGHNATWSVPTAHIGDAKFWTVSNGYFALTSSDDGSGTFFYANSTDGVAKWTKFHLQVSSNFSQTWTRNRAGDGLSTTTYHQIFADAYGTGIQVQSMWWKTTNTKLNASVYFRVYDNKPNFITWVEIKNPLGFAVTLNNAVLIAYFSNTGAGLLVGSDKTLMEKWSHYLWTGNGVSSSVDGATDQRAEVAIATSVAVQKSIVWGQITDTQAGFSCGLISDASDTVYGLSQAYLYSDQFIATHYQSPTIPNGANFTCDKVFVGFADSNNLLTAIKESDWTNAVLAFNSFKSEATPFNELVYTTWSAYGPNINDTLIRQLADFISSNYPSITWIALDDGWQTKSNTANAGDCLAMEVNTTRFPDMASTVSYVHSKGLKVSLWVDTGRMMFHGAINTTHPTWRLVDSRGGYSNYSVPTEKYWIPDITQVAFQNYLTTQIGTMQLIWDVDGFKFDFQPWPSGYQVYSRTDLSAGRALWIYLNTMRNATVSAQFVLSTQPTYPSIFTSIFANVNRAGTDVHDFTTLASSFTTYWNQQYLIATANAGNRFAVLDIDMITLDFRGVTGTDAYIKLHTDLVIGTASMAELSFRPTTPAASFAPLSPLLAYHDYNSNRYLNGQDASDHFNLAYWFASGTSSRLSIAFINWGAFTATITATVTGLIPNATYRAYLDSSSSYSDKTSNASGSITDSESTADTASHLMILTLYVPPNPFQALYDMGPAMLLIGFIAGISGIIIVAIGSRIRRG